MLEVRNLHKSYPGPDGSRADVVRIAEFSLALGEERALRGESGCGKTTFLNLVAGILAADSGNIRIDGSDMAALPEPARDRLRAAKIGYIFQTFNLLQGYTVIENVVLGMSFSPGGADYGRARELLTRVGLGHRLEHFPRQLSTGQQQRVAVARALAGSPSVLLADEPTGNLDTENSEAVLQMLHASSRELNQTVLMITHNPEAAQIADRILHMRDGRITHIVEGTRRSA
jgi:putative ABC transport system ATP-binding protein